MNRIDQKVIFAEALETSKSSILIGELAKLLKQNGINVGQNRLFNWFMRRGIPGKERRLPKSSDAKINGTWIV
ncbi:phage antirepressor KilAC domain-containing protein [Paenibacillus larvae]|nr:phage antirepressor KilAC domain-containing protein [Paenibacillus larvae]MDT2261404.1 phage antirepressor KilAC domain-containing protein [Paenibacillus larvae]